MGRQFVSCIAVALCLGACGYQGKLPNNILRPAPIVVEQVKLGDVIERVATEDADRFAEVFHSKDGYLSEEDIQKHYLVPGTHAIEIFTPRRIQNAQHLALTIKKNRALYQRATFQIWLAMRGQEAASQKSGMLF